MGAVSASRSQIGNHKPTVTSVRSRWRTWFLVCWRCMVARLHDSHRRIICFVLTVLTSDDRTMRGLAYLVVYGYGNLLKVAMSVPRAYRGVPTQPARRTQRRVSWAGTPSRKTEGSPAYWPLSDCRFMFGSSPPQEAGPVSDRFRLSEHPPEIDLTGALVEEDPDGSGVLGIRLPPDIITALRRRGVLRPRALGGRAPVARRRPSPQARQETA